MLWLNKNIAEERTKICKRCPLYSSFLGGICNPKLYLNPDTNEISLVPKPGFIRGCNCAVFIKMRNLNNHCIAGKW